MSFVRAASPTPHEPPTAARLRGIAVTFPDAPALVEIDVEIAAARLTAVIGPNGAGKSTLLEVLAGARRPSAGVREVHSRTIGFVPQRSELPARMPMTVRDVVSVGAWGHLGLWRRMTPKARDAVQQAMTRTEVAHLAGRPFPALSGGQCQRALLAQGLARGADLLLLDEPTTGLDRDSADRIRAVMREEADAGAAVVCATHEAALIAEADRLVTLRQGRIA